MDTQTNGQNTTDYTLHDLVAQGACYPMAVIVWHQLLPRPMAKKTARPIAPRLSLSQTSENHSSAEDIAEAAFN